jgi:hypothetical protein
MEESVLEIPASIREKVDDTFSQKGYIFFGHQIDSSISLFLCETETDKSILFGPKLAV